MKNTLLLFTLLILGHVNAQSIKGKIVDAKTEKPLAFVNIIFNDGFVGVSSDIDGNFRIPESDTITSLTFSYIGYQRTTIAFQDVKANSLVKLKRSSVNINEVLILPGENPAHRIINLAIANRKINNPEKASEFYYESYNKLVFTADLDSNLLNNPDSIAKLDSNSREMYDFFEGQHLLMMESVSERNHIPPDFSKEVITASRVSGFKNPAFSLIGTQLQSFSLYSTYISLFGENYLSPISTGSTDKYLFILKDTLYSGSDTVFTIAFQPRKGKNFDGLKGVLAINTNGYAVQNFIAEQFEQHDFPVKIQQKYELVDGKQWFPVQLNTVLRFTTIELESAEVIGVGKSYIKNIELKSRIPKNKIGNTVLKMDEQAGKKEPAFWALYRVDSLDSKEEETYHFMDSIGDKIKLDQKMAIYQTLFKGSFPIGPIDIPLNRIIQYNGYEGFRLGLGIETNDKILPWFRVGGYGAYGFKDEAWKYGYHAKWTPENTREFELKASYENDVVETGGLDFFNNKPSVVSTENLQKLFINRMDGLERIQTEVSFRALRDFQFTLFGNTETRTFNTDYEFVSYQTGEAKVFDESINLTQTGANIRFAFREKYVEMFGVKTPVISKYPIVHFKYTQGLRGELDGDLEFVKIDLKVEQHFKIKNVGVTKLRVAAGVVDEPLPLSLLYRKSGTNNDRYRITSEYSFETAFPNEFFVERYVSIFFRHSFGSLLLKTENFKPELSIISSAAFGDLGSINQHANQEFKTYEKGFFESGIQLDNLIEGLGLGVGAFYRYGPYSLEDEEDNFVFKLSSQFSF